MTYAQAAQRLNVSPHAVRARATRNGWRRQIGNDGRARVLVALEPRAPDEPPIITRSSPARKAIDPALVGALENHIKTLQGDVATLKEQLASEQAKTEKAIEAFRLLADRLDAMAETNQRRPWWKRLAG